MSSDVYSDAQADMASELLIRPGPNDHEVVADLMAPGGAGVLLPSARPVIGRLVVDAHAAAHRPQFSAAAADAGVPLLIDPVTPLWQGPLREKDRWAKLPFGQAERLDAGAVSNVKRREQLVAQAAEFQVAHGATSVIPPYPYVAAPDDPWFEWALDMIRLTARWLRQEGIALPLAPMLCARLQTFAPAHSWGQGIDRFARTALDVGPQFLGLCLSPVKASDSYRKLLGLFDAAARLRSSGTPVMGWRQGLYGPALVAAGLDGYETGIGTRETCDISSNIASRKPPKPGQKRGGGGVPGIYVEPLGRSISPQASDALFAHDALRVKIMCDDQRCCPKGPTSTREHRREHAVRTRARGLANLDALPHHTWRLHQITKDAHEAATLAEQANGVLDSAGLKERISPTGMEALARVSEHLRTNALREREQEAS